MKKIIIATLILFVSSLAFGQDVPFDKGLFKDRKDEFKAARDKLQDGYDLYEVYTEAFMDVNHIDFRARASFHKQALPLLFDAHKFNPNNAQLNYRIGRCYLASPVFKEECIPHFLKAIKLNPNVASDVHFYLGQGYQLTMEFDKAIAEYKIHRSILSGKDPMEVEETEKRIKECEVGKKLVANPERVFILVEWLIVNTPNMVLLFLPMRPL